MIWGVVAIGLIILGFYIYNYTAWACGHKYVFAYNNHRFEKAFSYYDQDLSQRPFGKEEILAFLKEKRVAGGKITRRGLALTRDRKTKRWSVNFPYETGCIYVSAPLGSRIFLDQKKLVDGLVGQGIEIKDVLPGKHEISIGYYHDLYPSFTKTIDVPDEQEVKSPYETCNISIYAPLGTWVQLGGISKYNQDQKLIFENIALGQYQVSVFTEDKEIEIFSKMIQIDQGQTEIHLDKIRGGEKIKADVERFFTGFNKAYKEGIINHDALFLHKFSPEIINQDLISDFKMWYIDHKDVQDAKSLMEVRDIYILSGTQIKTSVLETVYLTDLETQYRVVIEWDYRLLRKNATWQIGERSIQQSIVAYKNEEGHWIKY